MTGLVIVLLITLGCAAYQYLKGTLVKSFIFLIVTICSSATAFGYFETLSDILISRETLVPWAAPALFCAAVCADLCGSPGRGRQIYAGKH